VIDTTDEQHIKYVIISWSSLHCFCWSYFNSIKIQCD